MSNDLRTAIARLGALAHEHKDAAFGVDNGDAYSQWTDKPHGTVSDLVAIIDQLTSTLFVVLDITGIEGAGHG